jgi:hypothetical protein
VDDELTKVHVDLPNHWGTGGESLWARHLGGDLYHLEPQADIHAVRAVLDVWEQNGEAEHETCEPRVPGSFDDAPSV